MAKETANLEATVEEGLEEYNTRNAIYAQYKYHSQQQLHKFSCDIADSTLTIERMRDPERKAISTAQLAKFKAEYASAYAKIMEGDNRAEEAMRDHLRSLKKARKSLVGGRATEQSLRFRVKELKEEQQSLDRKSLSWLGRIRRRLKNPLKKRGK